MFGRKLQREVERVARAPLNALLSLRRVKVGEVPGALRPTTELPAPAMVRAIAFGPDKVEEYKAVTVAGLPALRADCKVLWVDLVGVHDSRLLTSIGEMFGLHPLALEDAQSVHQRPKVEDFEKHEFITLRLPHLEPSLHTEQISIFVLNDVVVTLQEHAGDAFDGVRERIREGRGRIRRSGADYLAYSLLDAVIDHFFPVLESLGDQLEEMEEVLLLDPRREHLTELHRLRRELLALRKACWPLRDAVGTLYREERARWTEETRLFLRDAYDHTIQAIDVVETFRELAASLVDLYLSSVSNKMNDVMKLLTIITTVFVPLGFIAGLYGMNFDTSKPGNMPELALDYGYPMALGLMASIAGGLLLYFWRRGWLRG